MVHQLKGEVNIDFALPAIPEIYKDDNVFLRIVTGNAGLGDNRQSMHVQIYNNGFVSQIEVMLDEYKLMWLKSWEQQNQKAWDEGLQEIMGEGEADKDGMAE